MWSNETTGSKWYNWITCASIGARARQDRLGAGTCNYKQFLNIYTAQSELDIALNGGPFPPSGGISGIDVPGGDVAAQTRGSGASVAPQQSGAFHI